MPQPKIPSAEEEALQAPYIDPIQTAVLGPTFGLRKMMGSLVMQLLNNQLGVPKGVSQVASMPGPNMFKIFTQSPTLDSMADHMYQVGTEQIRRIMGEGGMLEGMPPEDIDAMVKDVFWHDKPEFGTMVGSRGKAPQVAENLSEIVRTLTGDSSVAPSPYKGAEIGRPLGLSALMQYIRNEGRDLLGRPRQTGSSNP